VGVVEAAGGLIRGHEHRLQEILRRRHSARVVPEPLPPLGDVAADGGVGRRHASVDRPIRQQLQPPPNHKLRQAVTALAIGNIGKRGEAGAGGHAGDACATGCCDTQATPRSHDTSRIAWAKLLARVGEEFPLECPGWGGDIRLIACITDPRAIRTILTHLGEPLEPPPVSPARGPPTDWGELVQIHDDRDVFQAAFDELPAVDIHSL